MNAPYKRPPQSKAVVPLILGAMLAAGSAWADDPIAKLTQEETKKFSACMAMKAEDMATDQGCQSVMHKVNVTKADMVRMKACEATKVDVDKDENCVAMMKKHPELSFGHGRDAETKALQ